MNYSSTTYEDGKTILFLHDGRGMKMVGRLEPCQLDEYDEAIVRREASEGSYYILSGRFIGFHSVLGKVLGFVIKAL